MTARSRDRSSNAKNRRNQNQKTIKKQQDFETFINREFSRFEHVKTKTTIFHNKDVASKITNVLRRVNSVSERERKRAREKARKRARKKIIAVEEKENVIFEEKREREHSTH
jgi:hypothetical protein